MHHKHKQLNKKGGEKQQGFVILFAVIISALLALLMSGIYSISIREVLLSGVARDSYVAMNAADSGLECILLQEFRDLGIPGQTPIHCYGENGITFENLGSSTSGMRAVWIDTSSQDSRSGCAQVIVRKGVARAGFGIGNEAVSRGFNVCRQDGGSRARFSNPNTLERRVRVWYSVS